MFFVIISLHLKKVFCGHFATFEKAFCDHYRYIWKCFFVIISVHLKKQLVMRLGFAWILHSCVNVLCVTVIMVELRI